MRGKTMDGFLPVKVKLLTEGNNVIVCIMSSHQI